MRNFSNRRLSSSSARAWDFLYKAIPWCFLFLLLPFLTGIMGSWISSISTPGFLKVFILAITHLFEKNISISLIFGSLIAFTLLLLWLLAKHLKDFEVVLSEKEMTNSYLEHIMNKTKEYELKQIFPDMLSRHLPPTKLVQVFYNLNFVRIPSTQSLDEWESSSGSQRSRITLTDIWHSLTNESPVAVILGDHGSGKSVLLQALAYHMAERYLVPWLLAFAEDLYKRIRHSEARSLTQPLFRITSPLIPILVSLEDFENERANDSTLTLTKYITEHHFVQLDIEELRNVLEINLKRGKCLVLLDGVNDIRAARKMIGKEIRGFIQKYRKNRFIITSRAVGHDRTYFNYPHYHIDKLTGEQIQSHITKWYELVVSEELTGITDKAVRDDTRKKIEARIASLSRSMDHSGSGQQIQELAKQPLLLTLLILIAVTTDEPIFTSIQRRIQLYKKAIPILLQTYRDNQETLYFTEQTAIHYLGLLAFKMTEEGKRGLTRSEIKEILQDDQAAIDAVLSQISEASDIFTRRAGNKFAFSHYTYQEYFVARYLLMNIQDKHLQMSVIERLIHLVSQPQPDDIWREPFILAVAFQSYEEDENDSKIANKIIEKVLELSATEPLNSQIRYLRLAVLTQMEINPITIDEATIRKTVESLIAVYEVAFIQQRFALSEQIGGMICTWLDHLEYSPAHTYSLQKILYDHASIPLLPIVIEGGAECLEKLHLLQVAAQTGQITVSKVEDCVQSMCERFVKINRSRLAFLLELLRHSLTSVADALWLRVVLQLMAETESEELRHSCAAALKNARPSTVEAQEILELWKQFCRQ